MKSANLFITNLNAIKQPPPQQQQNFIIIINLSVTRILDRATGVQKLAQFILLFNSYLRSMIPPARHRKYGYMGIRVRCSTHEMDRSMPIKAYFYFFFFFCDLSSAISCLTIFGENDFVSHILVLLCDAEKKIFRSLFSGAERSEEK